MKPLLLLGAALLGSCSLLHPAELPQPAQTLAIRARDIEEIEFIVPISSSDTLSYRTYCTFGQVP
ncbi:MAG: hypothetical protein ACRYFX_11385 [Janthinobacterium lividum]